MKRRIEFKSTKTIDTLKSETLTYFQSQGFKLAGSYTDALEFKRGSAVRNMVTFNPLKWKSAIRVAFEGNTVVANFHIGTSFQAVTPAEEKLWDEFVSNYQRSIESGKSLTTENQLALKKTKKASRQYVKYALIGAIVFGIPSGIIAYVTEVDSIASMGTAGGAVTYLLHKINKDKAKG